MATGNNPSQGHKAENTLGRTANQAKDKAQGLMDKAQDTASNLGDQARHAATAVKDRTDDTIASVGQKMTSLADNITSSAPREGVIGNAASTVADNLRSGGRYLQQHGLEDMGQDITKLVRQHPMQSLLLGFGVGCLMGMALSRR